MVNLSFMLISHVIDSYRGNQLSYRVNLNKRFIQKERFGLGFEKFVKYTSEPYFEVRSCLASI